MSSKELRKAQSDGVTPGKSLVPTTSLELHLNTKTLALGRHQLYPIAKGTWDFLLVFLSVHLSDFGFLVSNHELYATIPLDRSVRSSFAAHRAHQR